MTRVPADESSGSAPDAQSCAWRIANFLSIFEFARRPASTFTEIRQSVAANLVMIIIMASSLEPRTIGSPSQPPTSRSRACGLPPTSRSARANRGRIGRGAFQALPKGENRVGFLLIGRAIPIEAAPSTESVAQSAIENQCRSADLALDRNEFRSWPILRGLGCT
jgi:hypothetical protein